jgi:hypothetical protein
VGQGRANSPQEDPPYRKTQQIAVGWLETPSENKRSLGHMEKEHKGHFRQGYMDQKPRDQFKANSTLN